VPGSSGACSSAQNMDGRAAAEDQDVLVLVPTMASVRMVSRIQGRLRRRGGLDRGGCSPGGCWRRDSARR
jgi:hypothetical protein